MREGLTFHHVGIGTTDIARAAEVYVALGYETILDIEDPGLDVRVVFLRSPTAAGPLLELLAPLGESGPLRSLIKRRILPAPYHTCYSVHDLSRAVAGLRDLGFFPVADAAPAVAFGGASVQFLYSQDVGLVELVESHRFLTLAPVPS